MSSSKLDAHDSKARPVHSCLRCAARKVKCDKELPCSQCVRHNVQCNYKHYLAPPKRHSRAKYDRLNEQLRRYETLLREHGLDPSTDPHILNDVPRPHAVDSVASGAVSGAASAAVSTVASAGTDPDLPLSTPDSTSSRPGLSGSKTQILQIDGQSRFIDKYAVLIANRIC